MQGTCHLEFMQGACPLQGLCDGRVLYKVYAMACPIAIIIGNSRIIINVRHFECISMGKTCSARILQ